jgi:hypothetical protein
MPGSGNDRKRVELSIKLEALTAELDDWLELTAPGARLEKHHSQLLRVAGGLRPLVDKVQDSVDSDDIGRDWRMVERHALELHRVWDFFREKLALRFIPWLQDYLIAADEYAWAGYEPAQQAAVESGSVTVDTVREPPLVCFTTVSTPFSIPRGTSYARDVGGGELQSAAALAVVKKLPIPVVGVPWYQLRHLPDALIVGHEVGHLVLRDFGLADTAARLVDDSLASSSTAVRARWQGWLEEVFADVYGTLASGAAYPLSLGDFLLVSGVDPRTDGQSDYPPSTVRLALSLAVMRHAECVTTDLEARFAGIVAGLSETERAEVDAVAKALVTGTFPELGRPLTGILDPRIPGTADREAANALNGWPFQTSDIRTLLAAAAFAFANEPDRYREVGLTEKVLQRAKYIQQPGTRFRGGSAWAEREMAAADAAATEDLYALLTAEG